MNDLPSGPVTFLFTDIEGSTQLWETHPEDMKDALARHDSILQEAIKSNNGHVIKMTGD
jgi:class 3 adenylate cyclase